MQSAEPLEWISGLWTADRPRVVILGAGFAGLWAARALRRSPVEVLLLDRNNYHVFLPLLYQVGAAELEPEEIAAPVRSIVRKFPNVHFALGEIEEIDLSGQEVRCNGLRVAYDYLIVATGSVTRYFSIPGAREATFPLKNLAEGVALRSHILRCFEAAVNEPDRAVRRRKLRFVVVGGGATGVEFAGALAELVRGPLARDFPRLEPGDVSLYLIEAQENVLGMLPPRLRAYAGARLARMGVQVMLQERVVGVTPRSIELASGRTLATETVVWNIGVGGDDRVGTWGLPVDRAGRVPIAPTLQVPDHPNVYVIGDLAALARDGQPLPMIAPVATQQGMHAARNILRRVVGKAEQPFRYVDRGAMVTIGRNAAVAVVGGREFTGFIAWVLWLAVHIVKLIGFRNRLQVLINWAYDYFFYERAVRLIMPWGPECGSHTGSCKRLR